MFAVVKVGGKQYRVARDTEIVVDRLAGEIGDSVEVPVSFTADGDDVDLSGGTARVEILEHMKGKKIHIYKYTPKKNSRKKTGHRQSRTRIKVVEV
ncbi:MAG: 50S ribosomal protein L21 [Actinomycetota bacterium]|jgi:large subunit ribosomal protein L21|nr:50S ribosomal protein L21 [Actinomycetota bacterium]